jgi:hypothetical protein
MNLHEVHRPNAEGALPRMLFYDVDLEQLRSYEKEHSKREQRTFKRFFDVVRLTDAERDFAEDVAEHRPDLVIFIGSPERKVVLPRVHNAHLFPEIPRVGLQTCDVFSPFWWANEMRFRRLGVEAVFSSHFVPGVDPRRPNDPDHFYVPRVLTEGLFRDYGEEKRYHVGFLGTGFWQPQELYAWRYRMTQTLGGRFVSVGTGRPDVLFEDDELIPYGENYARLINRCWFALSCSTAIRRPVEKCLQIPASMSCLVTDQNTLLEEHGFEDMKNCVVAEGDEVLEKLRALLKDKGALREIMEAGHSLVHENYIGGQARTMRNWFDCRSGLKPGDRIVQTGVMTFEVVPEGGEPSRVLRADANPSLKHLPEAFAALLAGQYEEAEAYFVESLKLQRLHTPANVGYAICRLMKQDLTGAFHNLRANYFWLESMGRDWAQHDPALVSYTALICLLANEPKTLRSILNRAARLQHPVLNAFRLVVLVREGSLTQPAETPEELDAYVFQESNVDSECPLAFATARQYLDHFISILAANGHMGLCRRLERIFPRAKAEA